MSSIRINNENYISAVDDVRRHIKIDENDAHGLTKPCQSMLVDVLETAQQRRLTLHRGDAVQRNSTPEEIAADATTQLIFEAVDEEINLEVGAAMVNRRASMLPTKRKEMRN